MLMLLTNRQTIEDRIKPWLKTHESLFSLAKAVWNSKTYWFMAKSRFTRSYGIRSYLESHQTKKLQLGAGNYCLDGWFNTDLRPNSNCCFFLDARKTFPFNDGTFDFVHAEHMIEHLTYNEGRFMLGECFRVLRQGGSLRISTPDLESVAGLCSAQQKSDMQRRYIKWVVDGFLPKISSYQACFVINHVFRSWGHKFIYDRSTLESLLEEIGFREISWHALGESDNENLASLECHGMGTADEEMVRFESMAVEAVRP